jgi:K+:H+ antiporter subunit KhtU
MDSSAQDLSRVLIELGLIVIGLAILARIASHWSFSAIRLYLLAGLAFGKGGLAPLNLSAGFTHIAAEIGVLLLLFMLGLGYTGAELVANLRSALPAVIVDFALNFTPGVLAGLFLKWKPLAAVLLGGVTYVSSSGVIAKLLAELRRLNNPETPAVLSILVLEDLAMAIYLPVAAVLLAGGGPARMALSVSLALATVLLVLALAVRYGVPLSRVVAHQSDEIVLLTIFGAVLVLAGAAQRLQVSAAIGAFLRKQRASTTRLGQAWVLLIPQ